MGTPRGVAIHHAIPVFAGIIGVTAAFAAFDLGLLNFARSHREASGRLLFERGQQFSAAGNHAEALQLLRAAYNHAPKNPEYHLAYIRSLDQLGRTEDAKTSLRTLLDQAPASGPANVEMARLLGRSGDWRQAAWYYHRALYGEWTNSPDLTQIRLELSEMLARNGARQELLSELLLLGPVLEQKPELRAEFGRLLLAAENWQRAKEVLQSTLKSSPANPDLWGWLGQAQMGLEDYQGARASFQRAVDLRPDDPGFQGRLRTVTEAIALDPTRRRLSAAEKHRRSHELLSALLAALQACSPADASVTTAAGEMNSPTHTRKPAEAAESDLESLEQLWMAREQICSSSLTLPEPDRIAIQRVVR